jgi:hypothetical protein
MNYFSSFPNRTVCDVLTEMRKCHETRNFTGLIGLIEEVQSLVNRMEAGLNDKNDVIDWTKKRKKLKEEIKKLIKQKEKIENQLPEKEDE